MESKEIKEIKRIRKNKLKKPRSFKKFINSIRYSLQGLKHAYLTEQSLMLHAILTSLVLISAIIFNASKVQWVVILLVFTLIMITELLNTAIEAVVDLVTDEYNELAKIAKDCASAAAFVASLLAIGLYIYVFLPQIIRLIF